MRSVLVALLLCYTCIHATQLLEETRIPIGIRGRDLAPVHYDAVKQMISNHTGFSEFFVLTEDKAASVVLWVFFDPGRLRTLPLEAIAQLQESQRDVEVLPVALRVSPSCSSQPITPKDVEERCDKRCGLRNSWTFQPAVPTVVVAFVDGQAMSPCSVDAISALSRKLMLRFSEAAFAMRHAFAANHSLSLALLSENAARVDESARFETRLTVLQGSIDLVANASGAAVAATNRALEAAAGQLRLVEGRVSSLETSAVAAVDDARRLVRDHGLQTSPDEAPQALLPLLATLFSDLYARVARADEERAALSTRFDERGKWFDEQLRARDEQIAVLKEDNRVLADELRAQHDRLVILGAGFRQLQERVDTIVAGADSLATRLTSAEAAAAGCASAAALAGQGDGLRVLREEQGRQAKALAALTKRTGALERSPGAKGPRKDRDEL